MQTAPVERLSVGRLSCPRYEEPTPQTVNQGRRFVVNQFRASPVAEYGPALIKYNCERYVEGDVRAEDRELASQSNDTAMWSAHGQFHIRFPDRRLARRFGRKKRPRTPTNLLRQVLRMGDFGAHVRAPLSRAPPCLSPAALSPKAGWPTLTRTSARDSSTLSHYRPFPTPRGTLTRPRPSPSPPLRSFSTFILPCPPPLVNILSGVYVRIHGIPPYFLKCIHN